MAFDLTVSAPWYLVVLCLLIALVYAWVLYHQHNLPMKAWQVYLLATVRTLTVFLLAFLLLRPFLKTVSRTVQKPILVFAQDNSSSIRLAHDSVFLNHYQQQVMQMLASLTDRFEIRTLTFGEQVREQQEFLFNETKTDLSTLFNETSLRFANLPVGAMILSTDGIYNSGSNPLYAVRQLPFPVYTIALGDTIQRKDILISSVQYNRYVSAGSRILMEVLVEGKDAAGARTVFKIEDETGIVFSRPLQVTGKHFSAKIPVNIQPTGKGIKAYRLWLDPISDELTDKNNRKDIYIEIGERKSRILMMMRAPHPDVAAIRQVIEMNPDYELRLALTREFSESFQSYDLVIVHQSPSTPQEVTLLRSLLNAGIPVWFICGVQTSPALFNQLEIGVRAEDFRNSPNELLPVFNTSFGAFTLSSHTAEVLNRFPPLHCFFARFRMEMPMQVVIYQKIGHVITQQPLLAFHSLQSKTAILTGEGLWRWRLHEFQENENNEVVDELLSRTIQYLLHREDKNPLKVYYKKEYKTGEPIIFEADFYNEAGQIDNTPEVTLQITGEGENRYDFVFSRTRDGYILNAGRLEKGKYRFTARTTHGGKTVTFQGEITIAESDVEMLNALADHSLMHTLASFSGGELFYPQQLDRLADTLLKRSDLKPVAYAEIRLSELIEIRWLLLLLAAWLALEWFIRKRNGAY